jgi:hypothetical protein
MTVMSWGDSEGLRGRCDARCHNAVQVACDCMCAGVYHGAKRRGDFDRIHRTQWERILRDAQTRATRRGFQLIKGGKFTAAMPALFDDIVAQGGGR